MFGQAATSVSLQGLAGFADPIAEDDGATRPASAADTTETAAAALSELHPFYADTALPVSLARSALPPNETYTTFDNEFGLAFGTSAIDAIGAASITSAGKALELTNAAASVAGSAASMAAAASVTSAGKAMELTTAAGGAAGKAYELTRDVASAAASYDSFGMVGKAMELTSAAGSVAASYSVVGKAMELTSAAGSAAISATSSAASSVRDRVVANASPSGRGLSPEGGRGDPAGNLEDDASASPPSPALAGQSEAAVHCRAVLRLYMMTMQDEGSVGPELETLIPEVVAFLAKDAAQHSTSLSFAYMFALTGDVSPLLATLPRNARSLKLVEYGCALDQCAASGAAARKSGGSVSSEEPPKAPATAAAAVPVKSTQKPTQKQKKQKQKKKGKRKQNENAEADAKAKPNPKPNSITASAPAPAATQPNAEAMVAPWPYYHSMKAVVRRAANTAGGVDRAGAAVAATKAGTWGGLGSLLEKVRSSIASVAEVEALVEIDPTVCIARFQDDAKYREQTLLVLAKKPQHFEVVCAMGTRHNMLQWKLYQALVVGVVSTSTISPASFGEEERGGRADAAASFKKHRVQHGLRGIQSEEVGVMAAAMLHAVDGKDLALLHICYKLLAFVDAESGGNGGAGAGAKGGSPSYVDHAQALEVLKSSCKGLNYTALLTDDESALAALQAHIKKDNVEILATVLPALRPGALSSGYIYATLCLNLFQQLPGMLPTGDSRADTPDLPKAWHKGYADCKAFFGQLSVKGINLFVDNALTSDFGVELPVAARLHVTKDLSAALKVRGRVDVDSSTAAAQESAAALAENLSLLREHLETLSSNTALKELRKVHPGYVRQYDTARGEKRKLLQLASRLVLDGVEVNLLDNLLNLFRKTTPSLSSEILTTAVFYRDTVVALAEMVAGGTPDSLSGLGLGGKPPDQLLRYLKNALDTAYAYGRRGQSQEAALNIVAVAALQQFCDDMAIAVEARVGIYKTLAVANEYDGDTTENQAKFYTAQSLVHTHWGLEIASSRTATSEHRSALFGELLETKPMSASKLAAVAEIALLWEPGGVTEQPDAWSALFLHPVARADEETWRVLMHPEETRRDDGNLKCTRWVSMSEDAEIKVVSMLLVGDSGGGLGAGEQADGRTVDRSEERWFALQACMSFGLTSRYNTVFDLSAAALCDAELPEGLELSSLLMRVALTTAVLPKIARSSYFNPLVTALVAGSNPPISGGGGTSATLTAAMEFEADLWNADRAARQLYAAGCWSEAGLLLMRARGIPTAYRTLDLATTLVGAFKL